MTEVLQIIEIPPHRIPPGGNQPIFWRSCQGGTFEVEKEEVEQALEKYGPKVLLRGVCPGCNSAIEFTINKSL